MPQFQFKQVSDALARLAQAIVCCVECGVSGCGGKFDSIRRLVNPIRVNLR